jgi:hypothetical protein
MPGGTTVDLSEAGMRVLMDGWGVPMEAGATTQLTLEVDEALVPCVARSCGTSNVALNG